MKQSNELLAIGVADLLTPNEECNGVTRTHDEEPFERPRAGELIPKEAMQSIDKPSRLSTTGVVSKAQLFKRSEVVAADVTRGTWSDMCLKAAEGMSIADILSEFGVKQAAYRMIMRDDKACQEQMIQARADWDNRRWSEELIEQICCRIAMGEKQKDIADDLGFDFPNFHSLRMRDDYVNDLYIRALQIQAEGMIDEATEIADDDSDDMGQDYRGGDKPNTAAVARSSLKVKHRQWMATKLLKKVYGDVQKVEADVNMVVDHAARLEDARKRKEQAYRQRSQTGSAV